jgi:hypothetical protein
VIRGGSPQNYALGTGNRVDAAIGQVAGPWDDCPVIETHDKLITKIYTPTSTHRDAHQIGTIFEGHEVDDCRAPGRGFEFCFEDEGAGEIMPIYRDNRLLGSKEPTSVLDCSK